MKLVLRIISGIKGFDLKGYWSIKLNRKVKESQTRRW